MRGVDDLVAGVRPVEMGRGGVKTGTSWIVKDRLCNAWDEPQRWLLVDGRRTDRRVVGRVVRRRAALGPRARDGAGVRIAEREDSRV